MVPDFLTHYHLRNATPFQTISDLTHDEWVDLHEGLATKHREDSSYNRKFGVKYRSVRLEAESILRTKFIEKGGIVTRENPHYLCLGVSNWWKNFCDHSEVRIPLGDIDPKSLSFTYPDSFTSMGVLKRFGIKHKTMPYHGEVFFLHELKDVIAEYGLPLDPDVEDFTEYQNDDLEIYIEAQVWSDTPISAYKTALANKTLHPTSDHVSAFQTFS